MIDEGRRQPTGAPSTRFGAFGSDNRFARRLRELADGDACVPASHPATASTERCVRTG